MHGDRLNINDAEFLQFIAKEVIVNLYAEACFCADEKMITDKEFTDRSNDLFRQAHKEMLKDDIKNNQN